MRRKQQQELLKKNLFESATQGLTMTHIHPEQSFPLGAGVVALVGWGSDYKAP